MGGKTLMTLALTQPERIDQLVIVDIAPSSEVMLENTALDLQKLASLQLYKFKCKEELEAYLREEQLVSKEKITLWLTNLLLVHCFYSILLFASYCLA